MSPHTARLLIDQISKLPTRSHKYAYICLHCSDLPSDVHRRLLVTLSAIGRYEPVLSIAEQAFQSISVLTHGKIDDADAMADNWTTIDSFGEGESCEHAIEWYNSISRIALTDAVITAVCH